MAKDTPVMTGGNPRPLGDENRHYWLAVAMAKATGADLQTALEDGRISHQDWADLVTRCRSCTWAEGCDCWLAKQKGVGADAPDPCVNSSVFNAFGADTSDR